MGEVITRGHLPHWYMPGAAHFVTYRLAGTLPAEALERLRLKKRQLLERPLPDGVTPAQRRSQTHKQLFVDYDRYLDHHSDVDWLRRPAIAALIRGNLYHHHGKKYYLLAYCIMPNHVQVLLQPLAENSGEEAPRSSFTEPCGEAPDGQSPLSAIMHSLKSYTANKANALLARSGQFWQHESYDHWVRDEAELERIVEYINANPVKANLVQQPHDWYFGSAHDRYLHDGTTSGFLGDLLL
jgi:putative transposase